MNTKSIVAVGIVIVLAIIGVGVAAHRAPAPAPAPVYVPVEQPVGAVASNIIANPYFEFGGNGEWAYKSYAAAASTTCSFAVPATSTLALATADFSRLASTTIIEIAEATALNATTTLLARQSVAVSAAGVPTTQSGEATIIATTTVTAITDGIVYPGQRITVKIGGADTQGTVSPIGSCFVKFRKLR